MKKQCILCKKYISIELQNSKKITSNLRTFNVNDENVKFLVVPVSPTLANQLRSKKLSIIAFKKPKPSLSDQVEEIVGEFSANKPACPRMRWTSEEDIALYKSFLDLIKEADLTVNDFKGHPQEILFIHLTLIRKLVKLSKWKGTAGACLRRLQKMFYKNGFNYRESRKLKRMLKLVSKNRMTIEEVIENFPGRSLEMIEEFKQKHLNKT